MARLLEALSLRCNRHRGAALGVLPADAEETLPAGSERSLVAMQLAFIGRAPA